MHRAHATRVEPRPVSRPGQGDIVRHLDGLARLMDDIVRIPGLRIRVGLDPIIGLIPAVGDVTSVVMSVVILIGAAYAGVPKITLFRMGLNVALDMIIGTLPVVGDVFDVWWKSNQRNMALLRRAAPAAGRVPQRATASDWAFVGGVIGILLTLFVGVIAIAGWVLSQLGRLIIG